LGDKGSKKYLFDVLASGLKNFQQHHAHFFLFLTKNILNAKLLNSGSFINFITFHVLMQNIQTTGFIHHA
jgi:hypothetical protein